MFLRTINRFILTMVVLLLAGCEFVSQSQKENIKDIIREKYPNFESEVQEIISKTYNTNQFKKGEWEWRINNSKSHKKHEYDVVYGYFRKVSKGKKFLGEITGELTGELSKGLVTYKPYSSNKGIFIKLKVNTKIKTVKIIKGK